MKPKCGAKKRQGEGLCKRPAGWGTNHPGRGRCKLHGGCSPASNRKAVLEDAREILIDLGYEPVENPLVKLAEVAGELIAVKDYLRSQVERLESISSTTREGAEQLRAELTGYQQALRDTVNVLTAMARLDIDERLARISEAQAAAVLGAIAVACDVLRAGPDERRAAIEAASGYLAGLAA